MTSPAWMMTSAVSRMTAYLVDEPGCLALAQMGVGEDQYLHRPTFSRWDEFGGKVR